MVDGLVLAFISTEFRPSCTNVVTPICKGIPGYTTTQVSHEAQRNKSGLFLRDLINMYPNESDNCITLRKEFECTNFLPPCVDGVLGSLCQDRCVKFFNTCKNPFQLDQDICFEFPSRENSSTESRVCKSTHWPRAQNWELSENPLTPTPGKSDDDDDYDDDSDYDDNDEYDDWCWAVTLGSAWKLKLSIGLP